MLDDASERDGTLQGNGALNGMVASISKLLKKVDDLRAAALAARALAEHFADDERQSILELAKDWDAQAKAEEDRIIEFSVEAEAR
jgi:hypothetical protein